MTVPSDNPIRDASQDELSRVQLAERFAEQVLRLDASEGMVVGVLGPWGSGKTSFLNLAHKRFTERTIVTIRFNPWMFSGAEQLVEMFFAEIAAQLQFGGRDLKRVAEGLEDYGNAISGLTWLPFVGTWIARLKLVFTGTGKLLKKRGERSASQQRKQLHGRLAALPRPIVVVLDDIDRLTAQEIQEIFRLVRLTASFPNLIYVLAFDRPRVEEALAESKFSGREYLEKILFISVDLPTVPEELIIDQVGHSLERALADIDNVPALDQGVWPDVFMEIVLPLISNMRDVRRYVAAVDATLRTLDGRVALADVLGLEAVRVFRPDLFAAIARNVKPLTKLDESNYRTTEDPAIKDSVLEVVDAREDVPAELGRHLVMRLFMAAERHIGGSSYATDHLGRWLQDRRVAHRDVLRFYLERLPNAALTAFDHAERAFEVITDQEAFDAALRQAGPDRMEKSIQALETYESDFTPEMVVPGCVVLYNLIGDIPERPRGMFDFEPSMTVGRVTLRLLRALPDPEAILGAVQEILPGVRSLSSKLELIMQVGYREGAGHKLIAEDAAAELDRAFRDEVRSADPANLVNEWDLLQVILATHGIEGEAPLAIPDVPSLTRAILHAASTEVRSQGFDTRAMTREPRLHWDSLVKVFGDEETLRQRVDAARAGASEEDAELFELVDRYLGGWRPERL